MSPTQRAGADMITNKHIRRSKRTASNDYLSSSMNSNVAVKVDVADPDDKRNMMTPQSQFEIASDIRST